MEAVAVMNGQTINTTETKLLILHGSVLHNYSTRG